MPTTNTTLTGVLAEHIRAVNAFDTDAVVATFADDAFVNDVNREIHGLDAIRAFVAKEIVGDNVTMTVTDVIDHHGDTIVRATYDGDYDKTNLPNPLTLTNYFSVRNQKIISLITIHNKPSEYQPTTPAPGARETPGVATVDVSPRRRRGLVFWLALARCGVSEPPRCGAQPFLTAVGWTYLPRSDAQRHHPTRADARFRDFHPSKVGQAVARPTIRAARSASRGRTSSDRATLRAARSRQDCRVATRPRPARTLESLG